MNVTVELDSTDFEHLRSNTMAWDDHGWHDHPDRFRSLNGEPVIWVHVWAHWFDDAASMILARAYLTALGESHQVLTDEAFDSPYVITTDYSN